MRARRLLGVLLWLALSGPHAALAESLTTPAPQEQSPLERERAREHFEQGITAYRAGRYDEALSSFRAAEGLYQSAVFSFNLARTYERLGRTSRALRHYRDYRRRAPAAPDRVEVDARILTLENALRQRGMLEVLLETSPPGATVNIDGEPRGTTPFWGELTLGGHVVRLTLAAHIDQEVTIQLDGLEARDFSYALSAVELPPPPIAKLQLSPPPAGSLPRRTNPDAAPSSSGGLRPLTYVALGAGAAALTGAVVLEGLRRAREDDVRELPAQRDRVDAYHSMQDYQLAARITAGVGVGLAAVGVTLLVFDLSSKDDSSPTKLGLTTTGPGELSLRGTW